MARGAGNRAPTLTATSDGVGASYDPAASVWSIPAPGGLVRFDFCSLPGASTGLRASAKQAIQAALAQSPARSVYGDFDSIRGMLRRVAGSVDVSIATITPELLCEHDAALLPGRRHLSARLASALRRWHLSGAGGLSPDLPAWLAGQPSRAHDAGRAVRTLCPAQGALQAPERDALLAALHAGAAAGAVPGSDYAMCLLVAVLALRPMQVACLKIGDLRRPPVPGMFAADLLVTRLKQRNGLRPREEFTARGLVASLASVLEAQCARAATRAEALGVAPCDAPMFPATRAVGNAAGFAGHVSAALVGARVARTLSRLSVLPECKGGGARVYPLRLRRTFATLLSVEGCGLAEISTLLDHTGPDMARAYIEAAPGLGRRLSQASSEGFKALAAGFAASPVQELPAKPGYALR